MEFFGMGTLEILVILLVALIVVGPGKLVEVGKTLGKIARTLRRASFDLTSEVTKELDIENKDNKPTQDKKN